MVRPLFAGVRVQKIRNRRELKQAAAHGRRSDSSSRRRVVEDRAERQVKFSRCNPDDPLDLEAAHRARIVETGAAIVNGRAIGLHMLLFVTPDWIKELGDPHDADNPRNQLLVSAAVAFCETVFGTGSVIAGRMDLDEEGSGTVDVFVVPVEPLKLNQHSSRMGVTVEQPLLRLQSSYLTVTSFAALQSAWAEHAKQYLDPRLQRGIPKAETGRVHVYADAYREAVELAKRDSDAARVQLAAEIEEERHRLLAEARAAMVEAKNIREAAAQAERDLAQEQARFRIELEGAAARIMRERNALDRRQRALISELDRVASKDAAIEATVETRVEKALRAVSTGLAAYEQGQILGVFDEARISGVRFVGARDLTQDERDALRAELAPGWAAGLRNALSVVHRAREATTRGAGPEVRWNADSPRFR